MRGGNLGDPGERGPYGQPGQEGVVLATLVKGGISGNTGEIKFSG